jgi:CRP-like cAMP-binding protein
MNPAQLFSKEADPVLLPQGAVLFSEGEPGNEMFVLLEGSIEICVAGNVVETAIPGALLGEMALIDNSPRTATAVATAPSRLAKVDLRRFHFLVQQNPFFATHVMKELASRLRATNALLSKSGG